MSTFPTPLPPAQASPGDPPVAAADGLVATDVVKTYGPLGLDEVAPLGGVALTVAPGESVAIMGPSGSGKTTLLHVLAGILTATAGSVTWRGRDLARMSDRQRSALRRQDFGFVFKAGHLLPELQAVHGVLAGADQVPSSQRTARKTARASPRPRPACRRAAGGGRPAPRPEHAGQDARGQGGDADPPVRHVGRDGVEDERGDDVGGQRLAGHRELQQGDRNRPREHGHRPATTDRQRHGQERPEQEADPAPDDTAEQADGEEESRRNHRVHEHLVSARPRIQPSRAHRSRVGDGPGQPSSLRQGCSRGHQPRTAAR
jgi:ABC-type oligopeptide transport system ATPase subunit